MQHLLEQKGINMISLLETKLNEGALDTIIQWCFTGMNMVHNFLFLTVGTFYSWDKQLADLEVLRLTEQLIHC